MCPKLPLYYAKREKKTSVPLTLTCWFSRRKQPTEAGRVPRLWPSAARTTSEEFLMTTKRDNGSTALRQVGRDLVSPNEQGSLLLACRADPLRLALRRPCVADRFNRQEQAPPDCGGGGTKPGTQLVSRLCQYKLPPRFRPPRGSSPRKPAISVTSRFPSHSLTTYDVLSLWLPVPGSSHPHHPVSS